jgi:hypothetical protein
MLAYEFTTETLRSTMNSASAAAWSLQMVYDLAAKSRLVYDSIAKIWAESDPVYDLPAIDSSEGGRLPSSAARSSTDRCQCRLYLRIPVAVHCVEQAERVAVLLEKFTTQPKKRFT